MIQTSVQTSFETSPTQPEGFRVWRPGTVEYRDAQSYQQNLINQRQYWPYDLLILLEHPTVITLGRSAKSDNLLWSEQQLTNAGIECIQSQRGGDITLHGPGQLVGYPIIDLNYYQRDLHHFLRLLESVIIRTLADFKLKGDIISGQTGVWVEDRKIASIGIAVQRWVSYHGFALNINNDLSSFEAIIPCGLNNIRMTSMQQELGRSITTDEITDSLLINFSHIMQRPLLGEFDGAA